MKVRYKITAAFVLLTITLLAAMCIVVYYITDKQQQTDFNRRIHNRTSTIASLLNKFPDSSGYAVISKLDTATNNTLSHTTVSVYNANNKEIYQFSRVHTDSVRIEPALLDEARRTGEAQVMIGQRQVIAVHYPHSRPIVIVITAIDETGRKNLSELIKTLMLAFFSGILLTFLVGWFFSAELVKPVEQIANTVNNISANNIENRLPESQVNDEWNKLAITFNNLLQRLQDSFEVQGRFISNASHELSTPLTAVSNQIDVTLQKSRSNEEYLSVLQSVQADVQHMSALTQQLLNIARTARGGMVHTEPVRVDEILMDIPSLLRKISPMYGAKLLFDELPEDETLCTITGNYELLLSAFRNLAENGCKYGTDHTVHISLSFKNSRITVVFSNLYEGLHPEEIEKIFQPFQRGSNVAKEPGYGLGLSLTRRIILLHKGEIKASMKDNRLLMTVVLPSQASDHSS